MREAPPVPVPVPGPSPAPKPDPTPTNTPWYVHWLPAEAGLGYLALKVVSYASKAAPTTASAGLSFAAILSVLFYIPDQFMNELTPGQIRGA
jgi:hypothetical protein